MRPALFGTPRAFPTRVRCGCRGSGDWRFARSLALLRDNRAVEQQPSLAVVGLAAGHAWNRVDDDEVARDLVAGDLFRHCAAELGRRTPAGGCGNDERDDAFTEAIVRSAQNETVVDVSGGQHGSFDLFG